MQPSYQDLEKEITRLRQELQTTSDILDTILDPVFVKNADFIYTNCNIAFTRFIGLPKEKILNASVYEVAEHEWADIYHAADQKLKEENKVQVYENKVKFADGTLHDVIFHKAPIIRDGKFAGITGIMFDITEKKRNEQLILESVERLTDSNLQKDKFFSILAHDLKNPLHNILGFCDLCNAGDKEYDAEQLKKCLSLIQVSAVTAGKLLDDLLIWANSSRGRIQFNPQRLLLSDVIGKNFDLLHPMAMKKGIGLTMAVGEDYTVRADENMMNCILQNLITNAIKYTRQGGKIQIAAAEEDDMVRLSIRDNGIGIPDSVQKTLFTLHANGSERGTDGERGTGLGLLICKEFIEKQGGRIWFESTEHEGTAFFFTVPRG